MSVRKALLLAAMVIAIGAFFAFDLGRSSRVLSASLFYRF